MKSFVPILTAAFLGTSCANVPPPDVALSHPANAHAAQSTFPPAVPTLMSVTNWVVMKPVPAPEHPHGHESHESKSKPEEKK